MPCRSCKSEDQQKLRSEINLHFPHTLNENVFAFPEIIVCLNCGLIEGQLDRKELLEVKRVALRPQQKRASSAN